MGRNKQIKIMVIVALCVAVLCLTLGFAAFSNILTISSSATVTPDKSDFKIKIYGVANAFSGAVDFEDPTVILSPEMSKPRLTGGATAVDATIDNNALTIKNIDVTLSKRSDMVDYDFKIVNEGKYDAYISKEQVEEIINMSENKTCTAADGTSQSMVDAVCPGIRFEVYAADSQWEGVFDTSAYSFTDYIKLVPGDYMLFNIFIVYSSTEVADGEFTVDFDDIKLEFSTIEPSI